MSVEQKENATKALAHWKADPDLASVREPDAIGKLSEPERKAWESLWTEVEALLKR